MLVPDGMWACLSSSQESEHGLRGAALTTHLFCNGIGQLLSGAGVNTLLHLKKHKYVFFHSFVAAGLDVVCRYCQSQAAE